MSPGAELKELAARKQALLALSEVNRRLSQGEGLALAARLEWLDRTATAARSAWPWLRLLAPLGQAWLSRRRAAPPSRWHRVLDALDIARRVAEIWRQFSKVSPEAPPPVTTSA